MRRALLGPIVCTLLASGALLSARVAQAQAPDAHGLDARDVARAVDARGGSRAGVGYDDGLWLRRGAFSLRINATLQARYEAWRWDDDEEPLDPAFAGGDLSGFALTRARLKLSGTGPCSMTWYAELAFGAAGEEVLTERLGPATAPLGSLAQSHAFDTLREAWVQWSLSDLLAVRVGRIPTAATRQLMTPPEFQQFVDVSLASAFVGSTMPGYTDRNRDHGLAIHGRIGARNAWSYLFTVTNGDGGDGARNVLDGRTSDNLAFSARVNHAFFDPIGYEEGALRQNTCDRQGEVGVWIHGYADRADRPHVQISDALRFGVDLALGYRGFSFTGAATFGSDENGAGEESSTRAWLLQLGYHVPHSAWAFAARWSRYAVDNPPPSLAPLAGQQQPLGDGAVSELAFAVHYYLNGHGNKVGLDVTFVRGHDAGSALLLDPYTGSPGRAGATGAGAADYGVLFRLQWQLAL